MTTQEDTEAELPDQAALDAQYEPIQSFDEWASLTVDHEIWDRQYQILERLRTELSEDDLNRAIEIATRVAAVDTGAIEGLYETDRGLTITIAVQHAGWETEMRSREERMPDFFKAQLAAFDLASEVAASREPVTQVWIRQLHEVVTRPQAEYDARTTEGWIQKPLPKGEYKTDPNHVELKDGSIHAYAPVTDTPAEMERLVDELGSVPFSQAHPVLQAAYVHYSFVCIHPFADGNGRVSRSLASVFLRRSSLIPLLIWADQRVEYFEALAAADLGNHQRFVDFAFDRSVDAFTFIANQLGPSPEEELTKLGELYRSYGGLTFRELNAKAAQIRDHVVETIGSLIGDWTLPPEVSIDVNQRRGGFPVQGPGFRHPTGGELTGEVIVTSSAPANASERVSFHIAVSADENARYAFRLESRDDVAAPVPLRLSDVHPEIAPSVTTQFQAFGKRLIGDTLVSVNKAARVARQNAGL